MKERFILQKSKTRSNGWVCTDTEIGIVCIFNDRQFNEMQEFSLLEDIESPDASELAKAAREMADWLSINHREKVIQL